MMNNLQERNYEIEGIRGWAAFLVLLFHFFEETFGELFPYLQHDMFNFFFNARLMVDIFFILSGDALSYSYFMKKSTQTTIRLALVRYFRLTFPIVISCLLVWLFMKFQLTYNIEAGRIVQRQDWLGAFLNFEESFPGVVNYALGGVFFHHTMESSYNPFLWTMAFELLGSILIFLNVFILAHHKKAMAVLLAQSGFFLFFSEYYFLFMVGMIYGYFRSIGVFAKLRSMPCNWVLLILFFMISGVALTYFYGPMNDLFRKITFGYFSKKILSFMFAALIVFLCYSSSTLVNFFGTKFSRFLGEISFPLYVFQFNILVSITSFLIVYFAKIGRLTNPVYLFIPLLSIIATTLVAMAFRKLEKIYLIKLNQIIKRHVIP